MKRRGKAILLLAAAAALAAARDARALDAQSVGMGNTGAAFISSGAALYFNPALLRETGTMAATAAVAPVSAVIESPITGPNTTASTSAAPFPLFLAGASYRLGERVVLGLAAYPVAGFGGTYPRVLDGQDATLTAVSIELSPGASFEITKQLAVGVGWRATYTMLQTGAPLLSTYEQQSVSGTNLVGAQAGVLYQPVAPLRLGLAYRSKVCTDLSGTTGYAGMSLPTTSSICWPHQFRLGAAVSALDDRLLVAADAGYSMFSDSTQELVVNEQTSNGAQTTKVPLDWVDSWSVSAGVEYLVHPLVPLRLGYGFGRTQTGSVAASYFFAPPGIAQRVHAGVGLRLARWDLGVGAYYETVEASVPNDSIANPGHYAMHGVAVALSATFRIDRADRGRGPRRGREEALP
jgi:long-subunit fatty acid transport protein